MLFQIYMGFLWIFTAPVHRFVKNSKAATYPWTPNPQMTATALSLKKLLCLNSSLACTLVMCTSTYGIATPANASRRATLVCVRPPGLMIIASTFPRASWMRSIMKPSWFDWKFKTVGEGEREEAWLFKRFSTSCRLVEP